MCVPKTLCLEPSCPAGFFESAPCTDPLGPKICTACSTACKSGEFIKQQCTRTSDIVCEACTLAACDVLNTSSGVVGDCSSGRDTQDAVQCVRSLSTVGQACGKDEWLVKRLTPAFSLANASGYDTGVALDMLHPFRGDVFGEKVAVLASVEASSNGKGRQAVIRVVDDNKVLYPRAAFFDRLDVSGSQRNGSSAYPTAFLAEWDAIDVMFSYDARSIYVVFNCTYDFIGKCNLVGSSDKNEIRSSDCSSLSTMASSPPVYNQNPWTTYKGCVRIFGRMLACLYDVSSLASPARFVFFDEVTGAVISALLGGDDEPAGLRPRSPPAWNAKNSTLYYLASSSSTSSSSLLGVRYITITQSSSSSLVKAGSGVLSVTGGVFGDSTLMHSLAYFVPGNALVAADGWRVVSFAFLSSSSSSVAAGVVELEDMPAKGSFKDMLILNGAKILLLSHGARMWMTYTHCAPCPANSFSPAGSLTTAGINVCKCNADYFGILARPVVDSCTRCINYGGDLLLNDCPRGQYKTNVRCAVDSRVDSTCAVCRSSCSAGVPGLSAGQFISRECDGKGTLPQVQCADCVAQFCASNDQYMDPMVVCSGLDTYDTRPTQACKPCRTQCPITSYVAGRCLGNESTPDRDTAYCVPCSACRMGEYMKAPCSGRSFGVEDKRCATCNVSTTGNNTCPLGNFVLNECLSGRDVFDGTQCSACNRNCKAANFSVGEAGQYILRSCNASSGVKNNVCGNCDGACSRGQYILSFCTGLTTQNRQCSDCKTTCPLRYFYFLVSIGCCCFSSHACIRCDFSCISFSWLYGVMMAESFSAVRGRSSDSISSFFKSSQGPWHIIGVAIQLPSHQASGMSSTQRAFVSLQR